MAVSARFVPIARQLLIDPGSGLSPEGRSISFAGFVRKDIARIDAENAEKAGRTVEHHTFVDGLETDNLISVRPDGEIVARWDLHTDVVQFVYDLIRANSPVDTGRFRSSQTIYADDIAVATPKDAAGAKVVVIASTEPYARKIEGIGHKPESRAAPDGLYQGVATIAQGKFSKYATVKFQTRRVVSGNTELAKWARGHSAAIRHEGKSRNQRARDERQPAVVITFKIG